MWFNLSKIDISFAINAPEHFISQRIIPAPPHKVFQILAENPWEEWFDDVVSSKWTSPEPYGNGSKREVRLKAFIARETFLVWEPGKRIAFSIDQLTMPLVKAMMEDLEMEESIDGGTRLKWTVHYELPLYLKAFHPVLKMVYGKMFTNALKNLSEYVVIKNSMPDSSYTS